MRQPLFLVRLGDINFLNFAGRSFEPRRINHIDRDIQTVYHINAAIDWRNVAKLKFWDMVEADGKEK